MLTIWRRHGRTDTGEMCPHAAKGRSYKRCGCPIWVDGTLGHKRLRESLETRVWSKAQTIINQWEMQGKAQEQQVGGVLIENAAAGYLDDLRGANAAPGSVVNVECFLRQFVVFCEAEGVRVISQLDFDRAQKFRSSWKVSTGTVRSKIKLFRTFLKYCMKRKWISENPASQIRLPKEDRTPTLPIEVDELREFFKRIEREIHTPSRRLSGQTVGREWWVRLKCLALLMRYAGLRIGDAVKLSPAQFASESMLFLYTQKRGTPVMCPLPLYVVEELAKCPMVAEGYWFWDGVEELTIKSNHYRRMMKRTSPAVRPHRFRDTFAVELIKSGIEIDEVSKLLGHTSIETTQKYYMPWIMSRQIRMQEKVLKAHEADELGREMASRVGEELRLVRVK